MEQLNFDTIILGGGPAGLSAAIYASRGAVSTAIVDINMRSEERRVGKECRSRWSPYH